jgi:hypothetical protein
MLTYFPKYLSTRAIICYLVTLALVSVIFFNYALPFQFMLFGIVPIIVFFTYASDLTMKWWRFSQSVFIKKLFVASVVIRVVCVLFLYYYYISANGSPFKFGVGDDTFYAEVGTLWREIGFAETKRSIREYAAFSDRGYCWWISFEGLVFGKSVLLPRIAKCFIDAFSCVLMYKLAKRNFGESVGRMTAVFCMLMPNMWYYCGVTLKETEMAFLTILFAERADMVLRSPKIKIVSLIIPALCVFLMFTFRTALAAVMFASLVAALIFSSTKQLELWKKILYSSVFAVWMFATVGVEIIQETQELWEGRSTNQEVGYESRARSTGGNTFAKYASASLFAPAIFTIPFSSMVATPGQENQMMMNGGNFIKNILSGLTIFAMFTLLLSGEWRKHVLPITLLSGYLVVLVFSNFAHSERFHFPVLAFELMFAAYGVSQMKNKHKRWFGIWLVVICVANVAWSWIKLAGKGLV